MSKTVDYSRNRMLDFRLFGVLVGGFTIWSHSSTYFGLIALFIGIKFTILTDPIYNQIINAKISKFEDMITPVTNKKEWLKIRPLVYTLLAIILSAMAYLVSF
jgi:hypothetical protein